jgi:glutamyl-tRNA synthetase
MTRPLVVTRFAPSPTGHLHIGGARSALFCWAFARSARRDGADGRFMIRIEDTDQARSSDESARGILEDLAWLGIEWDDGPELAVGSPARRTIGGDSRGVGPYFQARRIDTYNAYVEDLVRRGHAYPAFEGAEELEARRKAAVAAKRTYRYDRPADVRPGQFDAQRWERAKAGEPHVIRFLAPHREIVVPDRILGDVKIAPGELDDFVIRKGDGFPTYHFAVVIDDELMGVTHVMRAQEHLANTPRHVAMQQALVRLDNTAPFRTPVYGHMPLIFNMDGTKMSKRDKAKMARKAAKDALAKSGGTPATLARALGLDGKLVSDFLAGESDGVETAEALAGHFRVALPEIEVWDFRRNGYLPDAIINFVALLGWNPGMKTPDGKDLEKFDMAFLGEHFSMERIGKTNARFDRAKLLSFNADAIKAMSDEAFARVWLAWMDEHETAAAAVARARFGTDPAADPRFLILCRALRPRARTLREALSPARFALNDDDAYAFDQTAVAKNLHADAGRGLGLLRELRTRLASLTDAEFGPDMIHTLAEQLAQQTGAGMGPVSQAVRVAVTGTGVSPGIGETLSVLGKAATLRRIDRCLSACAV